MKSKCAQTYYLLEAWNNVPKFFFLKQLEYDKKQTYCLLEALRDPPFFPSNYASSIAKNKNTNFR